MPEFVQFMFHTFLSCHQFTANDCYVWNKVGSVRYLRLNFEGGDHNAELWPAHQTWREGVLYGLFRTLLAVETVDMAWESFHIFGTYEDSIARMGNYEWVMLPSVRDGMPAPALVSREPNQFVWEGFTG